MNAQKASGKVEFQLFNVGHCLHPEHVVLRGGKWKNCTFPSLCALIKHPKAGYILFDTGYSEKFFSETKRFPFQIYAKMTPVTLSPERILAEQLRQSGVDPEEIRYVILSHFHADHVSGLGDFPRAQYIYFQSAFEGVKRKRGWSALLAGFLPGTIPQDFEERSEVIREKEQHSVWPDWAPFTEGYDLFGDGSVVAFKLLGHAAGQLGLILQTEDRGEVFLCADACWLSRSYQENRPPSNIVRMITKNWKEYIQTLDRIHELSQRRKEMTIIPSHCLETFQELSS